MSAIAETAVRREITVAVPPERAFEIFTAGMSSWWPMESHHIGEQKAVEVVLELRSGGRWFERAADGSECQWGSVVEWEPPRRVVLAWHLSSTWAYDPDPDTATEIEVTFVPDGESTRVELEHRGLDRFGAELDHMRATLGGDNGWNGLLRMFKEAAESI